MATGTKQDPHPQAPRGGSGNKPAGTRKTRGVKALQGVVIGVLVVVLAAIVLVLGAYHQVKLPNPNSDFKTNTTFIYYRDGKTKIGSLSIQNRQTIDYQEMPQSIKDAAVAAENRTFWNDPGISTSGIARSTWVILRGGEVQGGSTITQQYIKIMYLSPQRTMKRKLRELVLAIKLGRQVPKEQILADYLNTIYFGRGAYGVQAAARAYFNVDANKLTLQQSAVLASVINNPSLYDPSVDPDNQARLLDRYHYVLQGMLDAGNITQAQFDKANAGLPKFPDVPLNSTYGGTRGFLINMVVNELRKEGFSDSQIQGGGLQVTTTFDPLLQETAVKTGQKYVKESATAAHQKASGLHAAIASVQVGTGEVLAIYGGDDYVKNSRNWATTPRPAASTFKTWATIAALRDGMTLNTTLNGDTWTPDGDNVPVRNEFSRQYGPVSLRYALTESINTAFVDAVSRIKDGPKQVIKAAQEAGVTKGPGWDNNNRIALGTAEVSPLDNASGYATLANDGKAVPEHVVNEVQDLNGHTVYQAKEAGKQAIEPDVASDVTSALESVVTQGTGTAVSGLGHDIAGKTGTAGVGDKIVSAWFVAYTKQISTAVMYVAGDAGTGDLDNYKRPGDQTFFGATYPAETWGSFMEVALKNMENKSFSSATPSSATTQYTYRPVQPATTATRAQTTQTTRTYTTSATQTRTTTTTRETTEPTRTETTTEPTRTETTAEAPATHRTEPKRPEPSKTTSHDSGGDGGEDDSGG